VNIEQNRVGSCVQRCPESEPDPEFMDPAPTNAATNIHTIEFHFAIMSRAPIQDEKGFTLIHPDGSVEKGMLANGGLERSGVPEGAYRMKFEYIENCGWERNVAVGEPKVLMGVNTKGMAHGTPVIFFVHERFQRRDNPRAALKAEIRGNHACATFKYKQKVGELAGGHFIIEVTIGKKRAFSNVLRIQRYPLDHLAGVQQRLKELGYDPGPTDGIFGSLTEKAVRAFQKHNPELLLDGIPGPLTRRELSNA
jgi:hypothetical protein